MNFSRKIFSRNRFSPLQLLSYRLLVSVRLGLMFFLTSPHRGRYLHSSLSDLFGARDAYLKHAAVHLAAVPDDLLNADWWRSKTHYNCHEKCQSESRSDRPNRAPRRALPACR